MDEGDKRRIGEEIEPGGRAKAPGRLALLQRFVNTHNHDFPPEWDRIGTAQAARAWLRATELAGAGVRVAEDDAARLRELREAIRALVAGPDPEAADVLRRAAERAHLHVVVDPAGRTALEPSARGVDAAVATLLAILHEAHVTGDWRRLKACRGCGYAFYDRSRNRSAAWCAMSICGNRSKNRALYRRRRTSTG